MDMVESGAHPIFWKRLKSERGRRRSAVEELEQARGASRSRRYWGNIPDPLVCEIDTVYVVDIDCPGSSHLLEKASDQKCMYFPMRWLLLGTKENRQIEAGNALSIETHSSSISDLIGERWSDLLADLAAPPHSDVLIAVRHNESYYSFHSVYRPHVQVPAVWEVRGSWVAGEKLGLLPMPRRNLQGANLLVSSVVTFNDTLDHLEDYRNSELDSMTKVNYPLSKHLLCAVNATGTFVFADSWGYKLPNGSWSGMMGDIATQRADIGGTVLMPTSDRLAVIEYVTTTTPTRAAFVFRRPPLSAVSVLHAAPFTTGAWAATAVLCVVCTIVMYAVFRQEGDIKKEARGAAVLATAGVLCQQGSPVEPRRASGRQALLVSLVSLMFLYTAYSANIVSLMQTTAGSIRTLADLLHSDMVLGVEDNAYNKYFFSKASETVAKAVYQKKIVSPGLNKSFIGLREGVDKIRKGMYAFHMELGSGYKFISATFRDHEKCSLSEIPFWRVPLPFYTVPKTSPYKELFRIYLRRIREAGLSALEMSRVYFPRPSCDSAGSFASVELRDITPILKLFVTFVVISLGLLGCEIGLYKLRTRGALFAGTVRSVR